jgi:hypothetical protein
VAYPWPKTIQTAIERKLALSGELKNKRPVVDDPRKEVNTEVTKTVEEFFVAAELAKCGLSNIFKGKFLAPFLLAALSTTPNKPERVSLPRTPHRRQRLGASDMPSRSPRGRQLERRLSRLQKHRRTLEERAHGNSCVDCHERPSLG